MNPTLTVSQLRDAMEPLPPDARVLVSWPEMLLEISELRQCPDTNALVLVLNDVDDQGEYEDVEVDDDEDDGDWEDDDDLEDDDEEDDLDDIDNPNR